MLSMCVLCTYSTLHRYILFMHVFLQFFCIYNITRLTSAFYLGVAVATLHSHSDRDTKKDTKPICDSFSLIYCTQTLSYVLCSTSNT